MKPTFTKTLALAGFGAALLAGNPNAARADDAAAAAPAAPAAWGDTLTLSGYVAGGIMGNTDDPANGLNFGHLYTDRANTPVLNQASLILSRPTDPKATSFDWGFTLQGMYGTDARYTHFFNEFDRSINSRYQFDIVEADLQAHVPNIGAGGMDVKLGQYPTPIGFEVINPSGNPFYSHSYIYNYSIPIKHTGILTTTHATDMLDIYLGFDWGNLSTPFGENGDNNDAGAVIGGVGINLMGGNLTILALSHIGPENPDTAFAASLGVTKPNSRLRYFNDAIVTYKATDTLTLTSELNYVHDETTHNADAYGFAQYVSYAMNDVITFNARGEYWRDQIGFFGGAFPGNLDFTNFNRGLPNGSITIGKATYEELTLGATIKPPGVPDAIKGLAIRPEIRYDNVEGTTPGVKAFNNFTSSHQVTIGADVIVPFSIF